MNGHLLTVRIRHEHDIVAARHRARQIAAALGFDVAEQTRIATAVSELARNAFQYSAGGTVDYSIEGALAPQLFTVMVSDTGKGIADLDHVLSGTYQSKTGMGIGIVGTRRLMDVFDVKSGAGGTTVTVKKLLPRRAALVTARRIDEIARHLLAEAPTNPFEEAQQQNQELLRMLELLHTRQDDLERVNRELEDTNRGVVALYAELDERADHLRRADELKTRFLSNMTHEFRTPVNSILALTELLAQRLGADRDEKDELFYIRKSAQQLSDLVNDLLDIAKVEAGKTEVHAVLFEVSSLFSALRGMLRPLLVNQSLSLTFDETEGLPPIFSDESKLSQILRNFISNALKYTERGEIRVSAKPTAAGDGIEFSVSDTGIGIPEKDIGRIFDEFVQIENPLQRRVKGTGLGLPLSKRLADLLGGTIAVESTLGLGSTFTIKLPLNLRTPGRPVIENIRPGCVPVLIIEDSDEDLLVYERALAGTRFQIVPARSIDAARAVLESLQPAAIVLDIRLHGEDSWDFLPRLKGGERTASLPIIVASTLDDPRKGLALGADIYCVKPVDPAWLRATLTSLVRKDGALRILTVDDEETARFIIRGLLGDSGYELVEAESGREGVRLTRELQPDVVLLDFRLTDMTGVEVSKQLRQQPETAAVPVILVTSQEISPDQRQMLGSECTVLSKSTLTRETLRSAIQHAVSAPKTPARRAPA